MDSEDHDIEIQRGELIVEAGDGEFRVGLLGWMDEVVFNRVGLPCWRLGRP